MNGGHGRTSCYGPLGHIDADRTALLHGVTFGGSLRTIALALWSDTRWIGPNGWSHVRAMPTAEDVRCGNSEVMSWIG